VAKLIELYRRFEIKRDKDRGYVVISPSGKLIQANLKAISSAECHIDELIDGPPECTESKRPRPKPRPPKPRQPEPVEIEPKEPLPPCERCGAEAKSPTAFRKDGLCGPCWIRSWAEGRQ